VHGDIRRIHVQVVSPDPGLDLLPREGAVRVADVQPRIVGHGPTLFAGLSKFVDLKLVSRQEFNSGAVAMRYDPKR
jgi:hypothetical protein